MQNKLIKILIFAILLTGISLAVMYRDQFNVDSLEAWVRDAGAIGPLVFILIYAIGTVFFLPGSVLTLAGGALFGPFAGTIYNLTGATLGALLSFLIARYLASAWVENKTGGRLKQLKDGVEHEGWRFVAFVRLVPLFPFNLLNYALGLTRLKCSHYVIASYIFMFPGAVAYTYLGYLGREAVAGDQALIQKSLLALALLGAVAFLPRLVGYLRKGPSLDVDSLKQKLDAGDEMLLLDVREEKEFNAEEGHIEGAVNISLADVLSQLSKLTDYTEKTIAIICHTDRRSAKAAKILTRYGFADVHVVRGGMVEWKNKGYPLA